MFNLSQNNLLDLSAAINNSAILARLISLSLISIILLIISS